MFLVLISVAASIIEFSVPLHPKNGKKVTPENIIKKN
jgi:hypothetical protein